MGRGLCSGNFEQVRSASRSVLRAACDAGVPLGERMALLDGVAQAARAAVEAERPGSGEVRDWLRVGRILRQLAVQGE
jgi:hypothetical protein